MNKIIKIILLTITICFNLLSQNIPKNKSIFDIVNEKDENINIGYWALIIAKEFDHSIDVSKYLTKLGEMTNEINRMLAGRNKDMDRFLATKTFLYVPGKWNDFKPFSYDLNDPLGKVLNHQLLNNYLDSRKGNCVSMPTLFLALMERIDPSTPFVGVKAPLHLFCRFKDRQTNDVWNVETTNGGNPARNQWYIDKMNITQTAIDSGLYLRDLTKKEFIAELIGVLIAKERKNGNFEMAMKYVDLVLKLSPNSDLGLVNKGALISEIGYYKSQRKELTIEEKKYYNKESNKYIERAKILGWKPESKKEREEYLKTVKTKLKKSKQEEK